MNFTAITRVLHFWVGRIKQCGIDFLVATAAYSITDARHD